jgi:hypothetical protein
LDVVTLGFEVSNGAGVLGAGCRPRVVTIALIGFLSGLALSDLLAVPNDIFVAQASGIETQPRGQLSSEPLAFFPTQLCHGHFSSRSVTSEADTGFQR